MNLFLNKIKIKVWRCTKLDKEGSTLAKLVNDTLAHAGLSMLVTSLTTAAAFFSSFVCPVTAIRCFSLFAGLTVTVHFLFMLSWLPASVLLSEKYCSPVCQSHAYKLPGSCLKRIKRCLESASDVARIIFDKILPCIVVKLRYFWIVLLGSLAIAAGVAVFYYPQLKLPDTREFQLFSSNHFFERYVSIIDKYFCFCIAEYFCIISFSHIDTTWNSKKSFGSSVHKEPSCWRNCLYASCGEYKLRIMEII